MEDRVDRGANLNLGQTNAKRNQLADFFDSKSSFPFKNRTDRFAVKLCAIGEFFHSKRHFVEMRKKR